MNQKLNNWLCKHLDKEERKYNGLTGRYEIIPRKGYVTVWKVFECFIVIPWTIIFMLFILARIIGTVISPSIPRVSSIDIYNLIIIGFVGIIGIILTMLGIYGIILLMEYKAAVCPRTQQEEKR